MNRGKYIIIEENGIEAAIIFPGVLSHIHCVNRALLVAIAAGFFEIDDAGNITVEGYSNSLNVQSRPEDAKIVAQSLFIAGINVAVPVS